MKKQSEKVIRWRKRTKTKMVAAMGGSCVCCGYDRCNEGLEFHHLDPNEKEFGFGRAIASPKSIASLISELKKCVLVCALCHREIHVGIRQLPNNLPILDESKLLSEVELKRQLKKQQQEFTIPKDRRKIRLSQEQLEELLEEHQGNKSSLARYLGVSETAVRKKLKNDQVLSMYPLTN